MVVEFVSIPLCQGHFGGAQRRSGIHKLRFRVRQRLRGHKQRIKARRVAQAKEQRHVVCSVYAPTGAAVFHAVADQRENIALHAPKPCVMNLTGGACIRDWNATVVDIGERIPIFAVTALIIVYSLSDAAGFNIIWRYFGWSNQALSVFTLWTITVYMVINKKPWIMAFLPAVYMTLVCSTYLFIAPECFALNQTLSYCLGGIYAAISVVLFFKWKGGQLKIEN